MSLADYCPPFGKVHRFSDWGYWYGNVNVLIKCDKCDYHDLERSDLRPADSPEVIAEARERAKS